MPKMIGLIKDDKSIINKEFLGSITDGASKLVVTFTSEDMQNWTTDKTFEEIMTALQNGSEVEASFMGMISLPFSGVDGSAIAFQKLGILPDSNVLSNYTAIITEGNIANVSIQEIPLSGSGVMVVNIAWDGGIYKANKTYAEIVEAMNNNILVFGTYEGIWAPAVLRGNFGYGESVMFQTEVSLQSIQTLGTIYVLADDHVIVEQVSFDDSPMIVEFTLKDGYYEEYESNATANKTYEEIIEAINSKRNVIGFYDNLLLNLLKMNETSVVFNASPIMKYGDVITRAIVVEVTNEIVRINDSQLILATKDGSYLTSDILVRASQVIGLDTYVGIASIEQTTTSTEDGGNNVFTVTLTNGTSVPFTVKNGRKGSTGERGTGILKVTTAPSSYTTAIGEYTPKYRIALSTVTSQSGVSEVLLGDVIQYSYYQYLIDYLDSTYAYISATRTSLRGSAGAAGTDGYTPVKGTDYWTPEDQAEMVAAVIAALPVYSGEVV